MKPQIVDDKNRQVEENPQKVSFITHLSSLGRERNRWMIVVPSDLADSINKEARIKVEISAAGTVIR